MRTILEALKIGDLEFVEKYQRCGVIWEDILLNIDDLSEDELAKVLTNNQMKFESIAGSRWLGKKIMGQSGFSYLYSCDIGFDGNGTKALKLARAFEKSYCSSEVKGAARRMAKEYSVEDYA